MTVKITRIIRKDFLIITLILLGLALRLLLIQIPGFKFDVDDWFSWSNRLVEVGFSKFYSPQVFSDYAPGYMYILKILGLIKSLLNINDKSFYLLLKLPAILADGFLALVVYKELSKITNKFYSTTGTLLIIFNPALIFNSTIWGQIDSIPTLFLIFSVIYLKNKKLILSSLILGIDFLIKPQVLAILPVFILFFIKNFSLKNSIKLILPFAIIVIILSLPFFPNQPIGRLFSLIQKSANQYPYTSLFAYNFWGVVGFWISDNHIFKTLTYQSWGYILLLSYWIFIGYLFIKNKLSLFSLATLSMLSFFFIPTRIHERYLYPAIALLIFLSAVYKSRLLLTLSLILSLIHFINLYYVYVYYNEIYLQLPKVLYNPIFYNLLNINGKTLSLISSMIFIFTCINILKLSHDPKKD